MIDSFDRIVYAVNREAAFSVGAVFISTDKRNNMVFIIAAEINDCREILDLQKLCYRQEAEIYDNYSIPPLIQTLEELMKEFESSTVLKAVHEKRIIGSVRAHSNGDSCFIGRLIVHPDLQNNGIGARLINEIEKRMHTPGRYELFTGEKSEKNLHLYKKLGYEIFKKESLNDGLIMVFLEKRMNGASPREIT